LQQQQQTQQQQAGQVVTNSVGSQMHQLTQAIPNVNNAGSITSAKAAANLTNVATTTVVTTTVKARPGGSGQVIIQDARTTSANVASLQQAAQRIATGGLQPTGQASTNAGGGQKGGLVGVAMATTGNKSATTAQLQYYRQQQVLLRQQQLSKVLQTQTTGGQKLSVAIPTTATAAVQQQQQRAATAANLMKQQGIPTVGTAAAQTGVSKQTMARPVSETEMALIKRQALHQAKTAAAAAGQVSVLRYKRRQYLTNVNIQDNKIT